MPEAGYEPTIPMFERAKTVHVLDRAATVIDPYVLCKLKTSARLSNEFAVAACTVELNSSIN
jgi:hypothetical protein